MTHCRSDRFAWRSAWMVGRATLTIEASRRTINKPKQVTSSVITWLVRRVVFIRYSNLLRILRAFPTPYETNTKRYSLRPPLQDLLEGIYRDSMPDHFQ